MSRQSSFTLLKFICMSPAKTTSAAIKVLAMFPSFQQLQTSHDPFFLLSRVVVVSDR